MPCALAMPESKSPDASKEVGGDFSLMLLGAVVRLLTASAILCGWMSADCARVRIHLLLSICRGRASCGKQRGLTCVCVCGCVGGGKT